MFWLTIAVLIASALPGAAATLGPFRPSPAQAIYLVSDGTPCAVTVTARLGARAATDRILLRQFDAEERQIATAEADAGDQPGKVYLTRRLSLPAQAGVHQIRLTCGSHNMEVTLDLERPLPYGVLGQNGNLLPWDKGLREAYLFIPPHAERLVLTGKGFTLHDASGKVVAEPSKETPHPEVAQGLEAGAVFRFRFPDPSNWSLAARGFPVILCDTETSARAIHASVEQLPDGTVIAHRFQREIAAILPRLLAPASAGRAEELIIPLKSREAEWLKDPVRNQYLLGAYGILEHVPQALRDQNMDPSSPWAGSIRCWKEAAGKPGLAGRPDRYGWQKTGWGLSPSNFANALAVAATLNDPINPYYGKREILNRAAASALRDLMLLDEDETFKEGGPTDAEPYPGHQAFALANLPLPVFARVAPHMPDDVRRVWTEAVRRTIDRHLPLNLVTCRNQSSHYLLIFWHFFEGSGLPEYRDKTLAFARRFFAGAHPAGWFEEQCGPDATYQGMTNWHVATYARLSGDPEALAALRRAYYFLNHTVAPEPNGAMEGASNFSHRTAGSFAVEQWGGGRRIVSDFLPEVGAWTRTPPDAAAATRHIQSRLAQPFPDAWYPENMDRARWSYIDLPRFLHAGAPSQTAVLPAEEADSFTRNLSDELIAVKRPAYYAAVYVGHPARDRHYIRGREALRRPLPGEDSGGPAAARKVTPFLGGGLSLFHTPEYGIAIAARNFSPVTHHGLIATREDGTRWWEDYMTSRFEGPVADTELVITGTVEGTSLAYTRRYLFEHDRVRVQVRVTATKPERLASFVENVPLCLGELKANGAVVLLPGEKDGRARANEVTVRDRAGKGLRLAFTESRSLRVLRTGLTYGKMTVGRVEVEMPVPAVGESVQLDYALEPIR